MPKRRGPGPHQRPGRRRRADRAAPEVPQPRPLEPSAEDRTERVAGPQPVARTESGRPLRPTQRIGARLSRSAPVEEPAVDYEYVKRDLRQLSVLALVGTAVLVVLTVFMR